MDKLETLLKFFGLDPRGSIEQRIKLQKTMYLLKQLGCKIPYEFHMYIHGPFCARLTGDSYKLSNKGYELEWLNNPSKKFKKSKLKEANFNDLEIESIEKFDEGIRPHLKSSQDYELLADIVYFQKQKKRSKNQLFNILINKHSYFNDLQNFERINMVASIFFSI